MLKSYMGHVSRVIVSDTVFGGFLSLSLCVGGWEWGNVMPFQQYFSCRMVAGHILSVSMTAILDTLTYFTQVTVN